MATDFRDFLKSSKTLEPVQKQPVTARPQVVESKVISDDPRVKILQEKTALFCKKFGEFGADALDDFFRESVERMTGGSPITETTQSKKPVAVVKKHMNLAEHASAIMDGTEFDPSNANLPTAPIVENEGIPITKPIVQNDIMSKAMALLD